VVLAGEITAISPTRWNQDSGEFWEQTVVDRYGRQVEDIALPYYEVTVAANRSLVDMVGLDVTPGAPVVFTVIGHSPVETKGASGVLVSGDDGNGALQLKVGHSAVVFARQTQLAWRHTSKTVLEPLGDPNTAIVAAGPAQVDELAARVDSVRGQSE
jgi:hypothetical protein